MSSRRHYERSAEVEPASEEPETAAAVGDVAPVFAGREITADEFARGGDLQQAFASVKKLCNGGRQVKMPPDKWVQEFAAWTRQERN